MSSAAGLALAKDSDILDFVTVQKSDRRSTIKSDGHVHSGVMKRILVPLDGSPESEAALREAFDIFPEAEVHTFHVVQVTDFSQKSNKSPYELAVDKGREILDRANEIADKHDRGIETRMKEGHAAKTIVRYAEENDVDHIVMGSTGRSGMPRVLLGSVVESVTRRAPCSVVIVREN